MAQYWVFKGIIFNEALFVPFCSKFALNYFHNHTNLHIKHLDIWCITVVVCYMQDFCENPSLFTDGTARFDVEQGRAGTCWFLSILSALADKPEIIKQVGV